MTDVSEFANDLSEETISAHRNLHEEQRQRARENAPRDMVSLNALVAGAYFNAIQLSFGAGLYITFDDSRKVFTLGSSEEWILTPGSWQSFTAYWIWRSPTVENYTTYPQGRCWQWSNGNLYFWDEDGIAKYPPQDRELFHFEWVDISLGTVRIRNYQSYVSYAGNGTFSCNAPVNAASSFYPTFLNYSAVRLPWPRNVPRPTA